MANNDNNYYYSFVEARAVINDEEYALSSVDVSYGINMMPHATLTFPVGQAMSGPNLGSISDAMGFFSTMQTFTPVTVYCTLTASPDNVAAPEDKNPGYPSGTEFELFNGYLMSPQYVRQVTTRSGNAALVIVAMGFPAALVGITQQIKGMVIGTIDNGSPITVCSMGNSGPTFGVVADALLNVITQGGNVSMDLWQHGIKPMISTMLSTPCVWNAAAASQAAKLAFDKINPTDGVMNIPGLGIFTPPPLTTDALSNSVSKTFADVLYQLSDHMWVALDELANAFCFRIIPIIDMIGLVPAFAGLGNGTSDEGVDPWRVIDPSEYSMVQFEYDVDENFFAYLSQVCVISRNMTFMPYWQVTASTAKSIGYAQLSAALTNNVTGKIKLVDAPSWLVPPDPPGSNSLPGAAMPDAAMPSPGQSPTTPNGAAQTAWLDSGIGDFYAQY